MSIIALCQAALLVMWPAFLMVPALEVARDPQAVTISIVGDDKLRERCVQSGLELRYRFMARHCRNRSIWLDNCRNEITESSSVLYEPVTESYKVLHDRLGDKEIPVQLQFDNLNESLLAARKSFPFAFKTLKMVSSDGKVSQDGYIDIRVTGICKDDDVSLTRLAERLSFGLIGFDSYDSGWVRIYLK